MQNAVLLVSNLCFSFSYEIALCRLEWHLSVLESSFLYIYPFNTSTKFRGYRNDEVHNVALMSS